MERFVIGIPREGASGAGIPENRVALTPAGVRELTDMGVQVVVEQEAGLGAGFTDLEYQAAGARIAYHPEEVYRRADLLLRVRPPAAEELQRLRDGAMVWGFLHLAVGGSELLQVIQRKRLTLIGYEVMEDPAGQHPILRISSEIAGKMAPQIAARLLESPSGVGILLPGIPGIPPADVVILGAGALGTHAALAFLGLGASVYVLDIHRSRLEHLWNLTGGRVVTAFASRENIEKFASFAEVLVSAVLRPGEPAPLLVRHETLLKMRRGSVILDFSIDQGGSVETTRQRGPQAEPFEVEGILHFAVPNVPSRVARTSSHALTHAVLPYLQQLLQAGWPHVLHRMPTLKRGVYFFEGQCVHPSLRRVLPVQSLDELLGGAAS